MKHKGRSGFHYIMYTSGLTFMARDWQKRARSFDLHVPQAALWSCKVFFVQLNIVSDVDESIKGCWVSLAFGEITGCHPQNTRI